MTYSLIPAFLIAAVLCALFGAALGILTRPGIALSLAAVILSRAPNWRSGFAWAVIAGLCYVLMIHLLAGAGAFDVTRARNGERMWSEVKEQDHECDGCLDQPGIGE